VAEGPGILSVAKPDSWDFLPLDFSEYLFRVAGPLAW